MDEIDASTNINPTSNPAAAPKPKTVLPTSGLAAPFAAIGCCNGMSLPNDYKIILLVAGKSVNYTYLMRIAFFCGCI